jgi:hypothetical protein
MAKIMDGQVRHLFRLLEARQSLAAAAFKTGMDRKTARRYRDMGKLPSERDRTRDWRTRPDPFDGVWQEVTVYLEAEPALQAKTLFEWLQTRYPGRFEDGQLRTLQRRVQHWRATVGPAKEIFFAQEHVPGRLCASDFTSMNDLGVTIGGQPFDHLLYHCVLTYSNWESVTICFSESFESLSDGLQNALWELGGVPERHRSDRLSAAVNNLSDEREFTRRYQELMAHYGLVMEKTNPASGHENGDAESSHRHFKSAVGQTLLLRGSRDFASRTDYLGFLRAVTRRRNTGRQKRLAEERARLRPLPERRLESCKRLPVTVAKGSVIHVHRNVYSVHSRLLGQRVEVRIYAEHLEVWYGQQCVEQLPRLRGRDKHCINYRHIIDWLVRKPGAFAGYRYRDDLFPTSRFRMAYDALCERGAGQAVREYLQILQLAARESEALVDDALRVLLAKEEALSSAAVAEFVHRQQAAPPATEVSVVVTDLASYDGLLSNREVADGGHSQAVDGVFATVAPADDAAEVRGGGAACGARDAGLRAVSAGVDAGGMRGAAGEEDRAAAPAIAPASGQESANVRPEAVAGEGGPAIPDALGRQLPGAAGERADLWGDGLGEDARAVRVGSRIDSPCGPQGAPVQMQLAGARTACRQARPEADQDAEETEQLRGVDHRRHRLCATESRGDGGAVHAVGGALRAWQRAADEQLAVLEVGADLQGSDDNGGGHRPAGAPQRDPGVEHPELSPGASQEGQGAGRRRGGNPDQEARDQGGQGQEAQGRLAFVKDNQAGIMTELARWARSAPRTELTSFAPFVPLREPTLLRVNPGGSTPEWEGSPGDL